MVVDVLQVLVGLRTGVTVEVLERHDHVELAHVLHDALPTGEPLECSLDGLGGKAAAPA
ncbi:MAG: hypothetical protein GY842_13785 [bacterium]|nr:hypothetical protein [bacterium]